MSTKIAIFDVDKTIFRKDSMFLFVWFGIKKKPRTFMNLFTIVLYTVLFKLKLVNAEKAKASYFYAIRYFQEEDLEEFFDTVLNQNMYQQIFN